MSKENKALVRRFVEEAFNEENLEVANEVYAPEFESDGPGMLQQLGAAPGL